MNYAKTFNKLSYIALIIIAGFISYFAYLLFWPFNPASVKVPITVQNHQVREGESVFLILDSCTFKEVPVTIEVQLVGTDNGNNFTLPLLIISGTTTKKGCMRGQPSPIPLNKSQFPLAIQSGNYKIRLHTTYEVNSIRDFVKDYDSEEFYYTATTPLIPKQ